ncbi:four helix bundle protein [Desulfatirhabdium butyrativorans]|uniref:four helix bundle protein n=1 Tax=Desulfatirhabdium butyrativorans TaxID=340467 RepID=UPI000407F04F|nr:four helix bundle protein [Desulfatirhabdium butyrativorans]
MGEEMAKGFKELVVWQKARDLAVEIYQITNQGKFKQDFGLIDQIRRAAVSVPSNIAEGDERNTDKESVRFLYIVPERKTRFGYNLSRRAGCFAMQRELV